MKTIAIAGGSGFVGRHLAKLLVASGYKVIIYSRSKKASEASIEFAVWDPENGTMDTAPLQKTDAVVNLAGAGVTDGRWSERRKAEIMSSRVDATHFLIAQLREHAPKCRAFIAASATGYYGPDSGDVPFTETDGPFDDFLAVVCARWEAASSTAKSFFRMAILRLGIVLGKDGGAYPQFAGPMKFGVMPILGSGRQTVSWVHIDDLCGMFVKAIDEDNFQGIYNAVAPLPVSNKALMQAIAKAKGGIKIRVHAPPIMLRMMMGDSSIEVLKSCTVSADKILEAGFDFQYPDIHSAAKDLVS